MIESHSDKKLIMAIITVFLFSVIAFFYRMQVFPFLYKLWPILSVFFALIIVSYYRLYNNSLKNTVIFLLIYTTASLLITAPYDYDFFHDLLVNNSYFLPYICIALAALNYNKSLIELISKYSYVPVLFFLVVSFVFRDYLVFDNARLQMSDLNDMHFSLDIVCKSFCFCCIPFLFLIPFTKKIKTIIIVVGFITALLFSVFFARRNMILTTCITIIFFIYHLVTSDALKSRILRFFAIFSLIIVFIYSSMIVESIVSGNSNIAFFDFLSTRFDSNSRGEVLIGYFQKMNENPLNWIFGLGIESSYYSSELGERSIVESGCLQIIMKIGLIGMLCIIHILFSALRQTKNGNVFLISCRYFILICMIETIYAGVPTFQVQWVLLWMCVGACHSSEIKELTNEDIKILLQ